MFFLPTTTVGRKIMMAVTGQIMVLFIIAHVIGNSAIYFDKLNAYAAGLHALPFLIWAFRAVMAAVLAIHAYLGMVLTFENWSAKPDRYAVANRLSATFAGRTMIWTGTIIGSFLIYHLLQFTFQVIDPSTSAFLNRDALGRPDVYLMVVRGLQNTGTAVIYLLSVTALMLHLSHGIQSSFQTWGMNSDRSFPIVTRGGQAAALILYLAYAAIPVLIIIGILKR